MLQAEIINIEVWACSWDATVFGDGLKGFCTQAWAPAGWLLGRSVRDAPCWAGLCCLDRRCITLVLASDKHQSHDRPRLLPCPPLPLQFEKDISEAQALEALAAFPGVSIINDRQNNRCVRPGVGMAERVHRRAAFLT